MNIRKPSSLLISYCIAAVLLLSLWVSFGQDLWAQQVIDNDEIVLNLDADSHANDSLEQVALISHLLPAIFIALNARYHRELALLVPPSYFLPPDRPPESV